MPPQSPSRRVHAPWNLVRRFGMFLVAVTLVVGVPLVAQALGEEPVGEPLIESNTSPTITVPTRSRSALASETRIPDFRVEAVEEVPPSEPAPPADPALELAAPPIDALPVPVLPPGPPASQWAALRECESGGDYSITNPSGKYRGAYQFDRSTWNSVAERHAPALVGVDPAAASPADQDAMAYALYVERGARPWPHCGRHLN